MDLDLLYVPLHAFPSEDPDELRERLLAALQAGAASSLPGRSIEVHYDDENERFMMYEFVAVTDQNVEAARGFGPFDPGDEIGFDIWGLTPEAAAFLKIEPEAWQSLRARAKDVVRQTVQAGRRRRAEAAFTSWLEDHREDIAPFRRAAWRPVIQSGNIDPERAGGTTYYGGPAWLRDDEPWPKCHVCWNDMELLLHLDIAASPVGARVSPAYEVFQCTYTSCGAGELARAVPIGAAPRPSPIPAPRCGPKMVVKWEPTDDYSGYAAEDPAFNAVMALRGDKLGGWPARIQGTREEPFPCPECDGDTILLYQLDSDSYSEWMWGDCGRAWLSACPQHPARPFYFWECS